MVDSLLIHDIYILLLIGLPSVTFEHDQRRAVMTYNFLESAKLVLAQKILKNTQILA